MHYGNFSTEWRAGKQNLLADALSRSPVDCCEDENVLRVDDEDHSSINILYTEDAGEDDLIKCVFLVL